MYPFGRCWHPFGSWRFIVTFSLQSAPWFEGRPKNLCTFFIVVVLISNVCPSVCLLYWFWFQMSVCLQVGGHEDISEESVSLFHLLEPRIGITAVYRRIQKHPLIHAKVDPLHQVVLISGNPNINVCHTWQSGRWDLLSQFIKRLFWSPSIFFIPWVAAWSQ